MSQYQSQVIDQMSNTATDMAHIIGRYKGAMDAFSTTLKDVARIGEMDAFTKNLLLDMVNRMETVITENELRWENRGKREVPTDIVELERGF